MWTVIVDLLIEIVWEASSMSSLLRLYHACWVIRQWWESNKTRTRPNPINHSNHLWKWSKRHLVKLSVYVMPWHKHVEMLYKFLLMKPPRKYTCQSGIKLRSVKSGLLVDGERAEFKRASNKKTYFVQEIKGFNVYLCKLIKKSFLTEGIALTLGNDLDRGQRLIQNRHFIILS